MPEDDVYTPASGVSNGKGSAETCRNVLTISYYLPTRKIPKLGFQSWSYLLSYSFSYLSPSCSFGGKMASRSRVGKRVGARAGPTLNGTITDDAPLSVSSLCLSVPLALFLCHGRSKSPHSLSSLGTLLFEVTTSVALRHVGDQSHMPRTCAYTCNKWPAYEDDIPHRRRISARLRRAFGLS
jgi:hypothetical protein